jgi:hypothetical protein
VEFPRVLNEILRAVLRLAIDYFRWTQLIPMLACWGFLLAFCFAIMLTSFESQGVAAFEMIAAVIFGAMAILPDALVQRGPDGSIGLSGDELIDIAAWLWFLLSIIAMLINWAVGERLRPRFLRTLSGRLKTAGVAAAFVGVTLIAVRVFVPENFNGSFVSWLPPLVGVPVIVWIVSAYSLCMSAMLSLLDEVAVARA